MTENKSGFPWIGTLGAYVGVALFCWGLFRIIKPFNVFYGEANESPRVHEYVSTRRDSASLDSLNLGFEFSEIERQFPSIQQYRDSIEQRKDSLTQVINDFEKTPEIISYKKKIEDRQSLFLEKYFYNMLVSVLAGCGVGLGGNFIKKRLKRKKR